MLSNNGPLYINRPSFAPTFLQSLTITEIQNWGVLSYGFENNYPQIVKAAVENCATGKRAASWMARFLAGDGFVVPELEKVKVNNKGWTLGKLRTYCANQVAIFNTISLELRLNAFGQIVEVYPLEVPLVRLGFDFYKSEKPPKNWTYEDIAFGNKDLNGYCAIFDNWAGESPRVNATIGQSEFIWLPVYEGDRREDYLDSFNDWREYAQSVYYRPLTETPNYAHSMCHSVINDMQSWADASTFTQKEFRNGLSAGHLIEVLGSFEDTRRKDELLKYMQSVQGSENAGNLLIVAGGTRNTDTGKMESSLQITPIDRGNAYEMFVALNEQINDRVATCYGTPPSLLSLDSKAVFSSQNRAEDFEAYNNVLASHISDFHALLEPVITSFIGENIDTRILPATYKTSLKNAE